MPTLQSPFFSQLQGNLVGVSVVKLDPLIHWLNAALYFQLSVHAQKGLQYLVCV